MSRTVLFFFFVSWSFLSFSQNRDRNFEAFVTENDHFKIRVNDGEYRIQFFNSEIVETVFIPKGEVYKKASHAVVLKAKQTKTTTKTSENFVQISSEGIVVKIQKNPFQILYTYKDNPIISEKNGYVKKDSLETIQFNLTPDEVLYGGGARALGMNRRGHRLQLYNKAHYGYETKSDLMNFTLPVVMSSKKYMIHFDNAPVGFLDLDSQADNTLTYETISGRKAYQVIVGDSWYDITNNYTELTGKQPMPPRWALGNFSSRFGYHSQEEVETTIAKFKEDDIPVDAVILDLYWFGKEITGTMGNLEVYRDSFPDFEGMVSKLKAQGVKTITITEPFILSTSKRWNEQLKPIFWQKTPSEIRTNMISISVTRDLSISTNLKRSNGFGTYTKGWSIKV